jgi:HPt (histidine-containing phosphotransfer) domain-containing protein
VETSNAAMDRTLALSRVGGDAELLREIGQLFLAEYPSLLSRLAVAVANQDAPAVDRTAHSLKGSVVNFGAQAAYQAALELEQMGRTQNLGDAYRRLGELERALAALHSELQLL